MFISRCNQGKNHGKFYNTWVEGGRVYTQDVKTGYRSSMSLKNFRAKYHGTKDMKSARDYSNGK